MKTDLVAIYWKASTKKKLGLIGRGDGFESRKDGHSVLASGFFFSQLFSLFIFAYVTAIYDLSFTSCLVELSSKEMIKDSEEMSASLKQQISVFSRLVH